MSGLSKEQFDELKETVVNTVLKEFMNKNNNLNSNPVVNQIVTPAKKFVYFEDYKLNKHSIMSYTGYFEVNANSTPILTGKGLYTELRNQLYYIGDLVNGKRQGYGKVIKPDGIYEGEVLNNWSHGKGKMTWDNSNIYEGEWKNGERCGKGKMTWNNGEIYEGEYLNDMRHGYGKMMYNFGYIYEGEWKEGTRHGNGKMIYPNGDVYTGKWVNGMQV